MADEIDYSYLDMLPAPADGNLPGDIIVSILLNLPVKSLLRFKSVSKAWYYLITSHRFFHLHLPRQSSVPNNTFLVSFGDYFNCNCDLGLLIHNEDNTSDIDHLLTLENQLFFSSENEILFIIDSCNGLVCLYCHSGGFILWNPATTDYRYLDYPDNDFADILDWFSFGLCYVEATNDFKLIGWTDTRGRDYPANRPYLFVYSLSSDSWEKFDYDAKHSLFSITRPTFLSGCMNWLVQTCRCGTVCTCAHVFLTLDVTDGAISCFGAPDKNRGFRSKQSMRTFVIKGCLSIVVNPLLLLGLEDEEGYEEEGYDVWVMEEYGVEQSWVKRFTIRGFTPLTLPLFTWNDSEIVFIGRPGIVTFYDPYSKKKYCRQLKSVVTNRMLNYVETLAPVEPEYMFW